LVPKKGKKRKRLPENRSNTVTDTSYTQLSSPSMTPTKKRRFVEERISEEEIETHLEHKMNQTASTAAACFQTYKTYEIGFTDAQGPSATKLIVPVDGANYKEAMQAVHSAALPVLNAEDEIPFYNSFLYNNNNATRALPKIFNDADSLIEGKKGQIDKYRERALVIINDLSYTRRNFSKGIKLFHREYEKVIDEILEFLAIDTKPRTLALKKVLLLFKTHIHQRLEKLGDYQFEDKILGLPSTSGMAKQEQRECYAARCALIRKRIELESSVHKDISPLRTKVVGRKQKPHCFEEMLPLFIMKHAKSDQELIELQKFFSSSKEHLEDLAQNSLKKAADLIAAKEPECEKEIDAFLMQFDAMLSLREKVEIKYQGKILDIAMRENKFTCTTLVEKYNNTYPETPIDEAFLQEFIDGKQGMGKTQIQQFASILKIESKFFFADQEPEPPSRVARQLFEN